MIYTVYGLSVAAEMVIPEIECIDPAGRQTSDLQIEWGRLPEYLSGGQRLASALEMKDRDILYTFPSIGRFLVSDGNRVVVDMNSDVAEHDMRAFLFGSVIGTVIHQRGLVPLHISALRTPDGLVAFTGESGAGKSTTAAMMHRKTGLPLFTDDMAVIRPWEEDLVLYAGVRRLKLWNDALDLIGSDRQDLVRDVTRFDKFHLCAAEMFDHRPDRLIELTQLCWGETEHSEQLEGMEKFAVAAGSVYRHYLAEITENVPQILKTCKEVADKIPVRRLTRPSPN